MKIIINRYWGDDTCTKGTMLFVDDVEGQDRVMLECECREPRFCDYEEAFAGCSRMCLPVGEFKCKVRATELSPMTLVLCDVPGHRGCRIGWHAVAQCRGNEVLVGMSDGYEDAEWRGMVRQKEVFERIENLVYCAFVGEEDIVVRVENFSIYY